MTDQDQQLKWHDGPYHYGKASRLLHWCVFILVCSSFGLAWTWSIPGRGPLQNTMVDVHRIIGVIVLLLSIIRIAWKIYIRPKTLSYEPFWIQISAKTIQIIMICLLVLIPISGWLYTNAGGIDVRLFGHTLPHLVERDHYLEDISVQFHETAAATFLFVLAIHCVGAVRYWRQRHH